ncbi:MAG: ribosome biogenesis GTPase Der [Proteobacteria bacterium SW_6_67_9]|nr:MAG: ribosome biogenesis GTPase Der [Proteobacteria bacterium SW_6_67_9]
MTPVLALVGRPNVGKSTLFNALTRTRQALVAEVPGLTRDRQYGLAQLGGRRFIVVDTGGVTAPDAPLDERMLEQTDAAIAEADGVLVLADARAGLTPDDEAVIDRLRRSGKAFRIVANKADGIDHTAALAEFHGLTGEAPLALSAHRRHGWRQLSQTLTALLPALAQGDEAAGDDSADERIRIAVVGRRNVGKSTLINRLVGEERVLAFDAPGTTRDAVEIPFERDGGAYTLIDTAGLRRKSRTRETVEKFSAVKTLEAIERAHVVILVLDAQQGLVEQDQHVVGHVLDAGRALVLAINKWDGLERETKRRVRSEHDRRFGFVEFARTRYISALHGTGVGELLDDVRTAYASARIDLSTHALTRVLEDAVASHQPPLVGGRRVKLRYAHQGGTNPPTIVIHGTRVARLPGAYKRYLENTFRRVFGLEGTPIRMELRSGDNPYAPGEDRSAKKRATKTTKKKTASKR